MKNTLSDSQILFASHSSLRLNVRDTEDEEEWMSIDCIRRCVCVCLSIKFIKNVNNHNINISNFINHTTTSINFAYHKITTQNCRYNRSAREGTIQKKIVHKTYDELAHLHNWQSALHDLHHRHDSHFFLLIIFSFFIFSLSFCVFCCTFSLLIHLTLHGHRERTQCDRTGYYQTL